MPHMHQHLLLGLNPHPQSWGGGGEAVPASTHRRERLEEPGLRLSVRCLVLNVLLSVNYLGFRVLGCRVARDACPACTNTSCSV